jgi:Fur family ferric uptake transcriptional regulator
MNKNKARDIFLGYLKEKGLRNTRQRKDILDTFLSAGKHITAEELFDLVKKNDPEIGYATVHRNLKLMCECGIADEIKIGTKKTRYEQKYGHEHHDHLICLRCGKFIEVHDDKIEKLQEKLAEANDFIAQRHRLEIYGLCKKCR